MTVIFAGGELEDFVLQGVVTFTGSNVRTAYARAGLAPEASTGGMGTFVKAPFAAGASLGVTVRAYLNNIGFTANNVFLWLSSGGSARLGLRIVSGSSPTTIALVSITSGGTQTVLATSTSTVATSVLYKLDLLIDYQVAGRVRFFVDQVLFIDFSGDVTASGSTTLDALHLGSARASTSSNWSEIIVTDGQDPRTLSLKTLAPDSAGSANAWTGAYTDVDETVASDTDVMSSATAGQVANLGLTGMPAGWSNLTVTAVKVVASAARGAAGPTKLAVGVRTNSTDSFPAAVTLDTGFSAATSTMYALNPVTGLAWTTGEVDALQIALKSEA